MKLSGRDKIDGKTAVEWNNKGSALRKLGRHEDAIACYDRALAIDPDAAVVWGNKGSALNELGRYADAIACFDRALAIDPDYAAAWYNKGYALNRLGRYADAITCCDKALAIDPDIAAIWGNKGYALDELGRHEDAIVCFDRALAIDPDAAALWINKGGALHQLGRREDAIVCFDRALAIDPNVDVTWFSKGGALHQLGRREDAIVCFDKALAIDPDAAVVWHHKGLALDELGRYEDAIACYDKVLAIDPNHAGAKRCREIAEERLRGDDKSEASSFISSIESDIRALRSSGVTTEEAERLLERAEAELNKNRIEEAIGYAKQSEEVVKRIQEAHKPEMVLDIPEETFQPNTWKNIEITIRNRGAISAENIDIEPSGDVEFRRPPTISQLNRNEAKTVNIAMKPTASGDVPIDIVLTYRDALDRDYRSSEEVWMTVAESISEQTPSLAPGDFTPRPTTPSTFPPELVHLYHDPVYAGKGGFARVFKAKRKTDNKTVAVKIPISLDEGTGRSFLREITSWQRLNHGNIITLYDANILPIPYLEMEYADFGSLDQMNKPVDVDTASEIILEIAEGLSYSHAQGVIHRDLKPMNVLLTEDLTPKISDWGLSKIIAESKTSSIYGFSALYGSPEQISPKKFGKPDERTDIYQLGVIFYELLTGRTPFEGDDLVEVSTAIVTEEPSPPSSINPEVKIIDPIILKCLAKKKEDRYQKIGELQNDLASTLKTQLKESLRMSVSEHNLKRSAFYCAEICLINARLGEIDDVMMYLKDMQNYASEEVKTEVAELLEELERRRGMSSKEKISEEFVGRLKSVLHQVRMGR